jgi:hypothetical protein
MTPPLLDERYAALVADAEQPAFAKIPADYFEPDGPDDPITREERIEDITFGIRTALWRLVETLNLEQLQAEGAARATLIEDLATDARYLGFEFYGCDPGLELYAELRAALAPVHAKQIEALGPRGPVALVRTASLIVSRQDPADLDPDRDTEIAAALAADSATYLAQAIEALDRPWGSASKHPLDDPHYLVWPDAEPWQKHKRPPGHPGARNPGRGKAKRAKRAKQHGKRRK